MIARIRLYLPILIALVVVLGLLFAVESWADDRCQRKGGHLVTVYRGWICVSADGRVIE